VLAAAPVGEIVDTSDGRWGRATATFDRARTYRFRLSRVWDPSAPRVNWLKLNPSTADAFRLDPTVVRTLNFAQAWGAGAVEVTNVFALRSTNPAGLRVVADPVGPGNDEAILAAAQAADLVVVAWGVHATYRDRQVHVRALLANAGVPVHVVHLTKSGHPGHPLYVAADACPTAWTL
jgi:hypothetical protein